LSLTALFLAYSQSNSANLPESKRETPDGYKSHDKPDRRWNDQNYSKCNMPSIVMPPGLEKQMKPRYLCKAADERS